VWEAIVTLLAEFQRASRIRTDKVTEIKTWRWQTSKAKRIHISASKVYHIMLDSKNDVTDLNRWWNLQDLPIIWKVRWLLIWSADIALRGRMFLWRIVAQGLFTDERASKFIAGTENCRSQTELESIQHIFFTCLFAQNIWKQIAIFYSTPQGNNLVTNSQNFIELLDECIGKKAGNTAQILILYKIAFILWKCRNKQVFQDKEQIY
jgi:hypothetical protein